MCIANPGVVTLVEGDTAQVNFGGLSIEAGAALFPQVKAGDRVLVHAGFIIQILDEQAGLELEALIRETLEDTHA